MSEQRLLIAKRNAIRLNVSKEIDKSVKLCDESEKPDSSKIQVSIQKLQDYRERLSQLNDEIIVNVSDDNLEAEATKPADVDDEILERINFLSVKQSESVAARIAETVSVVNSSADCANVKLPKLQMQKFNGNALDWQSFWDSYETTIHKNNSLSEVEKFKYLRSFLGDEALRIVDGFRLTAANYEAVIEILTQRYGDPQIAIFSHFEALLNLRAASHDVPQLQSVFDDCEKHIRSLVALGLSEDTFGQVFTPILLSKLPKFVRIELHRKNGSNVWKLSTLRELLKDEIHARSMSERSIVTSDKEQNSNNKASSNQNYPSQSKNNYVQRNGAKQRSTTSSLLSTERKVRCGFCKGDHYSDECQIYPTLQGRRAQMKGRCLSCMRNGHNVNCCQNPLPCYHCKKTGHHRSLCFEKFGRLGNKKSSSDSTLTTDGHQIEANDTTVAPNSTLLSHGEKAILQTAVTSVAGKQSCEARLLFDTGGSRSFVTKDLCKKVGARYKGNDVVSIAGFSDTKRKTVTYQLYELDIVLRDGTKKTISANAIDVISCPVQKLPIDQKKHPFITSIPLAEPLCTEPELVKIDMLIGGDYYYDFVSNEQIKFSDGLVLLSSSVGYIAAGRIVSPTDRNSAHSALFIKTEPAPNFDLEQFWRLEDIGIKDVPVCKDDEIAVDSFNKTVRFESGRYSVKWPWKTEEPELNDNYYLSLGRLKSLWKRLKQNEETLKRYDNVIQEQVAKNVVEEIPDQPHGSIVHYLPHHCVITPTKVTTKLRVVYDASAKIHKDDKSLNECMYRGPVLLEDLGGLLLRFRLKKVAVVSDIEKAFLQISLQKPDRDATRFLWVRDITKPPDGANLVAYRFTRVMFGVISSPFLLAATVQHHLKQDNGDTSKKIIQNTYVDNVIISETDTEAALQFYKNAKSLFEQASMNLREWYSNDTKFMSEIASKDKGEETSTKVLGMVWNTDEDSLSYTASFPDGCVVSTKRQMIQAIAKVFDPCGFIAPVVIKGKMLLQELWRKKYSWDQKLSDDILKQWDDIFSDLRHIADVKIPRCVNNTIRVIEDCSLDLHCFCDASGKAYSAVVYLKVTSNGSTSVDIVFAKCRVSPLKEQSIPRLELIAVVMGTRALKYVESQLRLAQVNKFLWTDSQCALHWVLGKQVSVTFVQNRVKEIKQHSDVEFRYVPTASNPADLPTRGLTVGRLQDSSLWWHGPDWLCGPRTEWPENPVHPSSAIKHRLLPTEISTETQVVVNETTEPLLDTSRYSTLKRLLRVTAWVKRFVKNCRKYDVQSGTIDAAEIADAKMYWDKRVQREMFSTIVDNQQKLKEDKQFCQQGLFKDNDGLVRCHGRLQEAELSHESKYPKLLPKNSRYTTLVIADCHEKAFHSGVKQTLGMLRLEYWIAQGRSQVKKALRDCRLCRKLDGGPFRTPHQPPLPDFRVSKQSPFASVGIDYLGPLYIRSESENNKVWICLFTCGSTRAIHLEVVDSLSTSQFLLCLRRFVSLYGKPCTIVSDNAKQFHAAHRVLDKLWRDIQNSSDVQEFSANNNIHWKYITELAPWMGGFYERMIGLVKRALKRSLNKKQATLCELQTVACEISHLLNSRPLCYIDEDVNDHVLTPCHLLARSPVGYSNVTNNKDNDVDYEAKPDSASKLIIEWKRIQSLISSFWQIWRRDYLLSLREYRWQHKQRNASKMEPKEGTIVLIGDDTRRSQWKIGRIYQLHYSDDRECRSATVLLPSGKRIKRAIKMLFPLEYSDSETVSFTSGGGSGNVRAESYHPENVRAQPVYANEIRVPRKSAVDARQRIKQILGDNSTQQL